MLKMAVNIEDGLSKAQGTNHLAQTADRYRSRSNQPARRDNRRFERRRQTSPAPKANAVKLPKREPKPDDTCFKCGKKGHWADKCRAKPVYRANAIVDVIDSSDPGEGAVTIDVSKCLEDPNLQTDDDQKYEARDSDNRNEDWDHSTNTESDASSINYGIRSSMMTTYDLDAQTVRGYQAKFVDRPTPLLHRNRAHTKSGDKNHFAGTTSECISGYLAIGGMKAHVLIDTGSEVQLISPDFAQTAGIKIQRLETPVGLQLATSGSRTTINYGCETTLLAGKTEVHCYWDIARIDYFDAVIGVQALRALGCVIDIAKNQVFLPESIPLIDESNRVHPRKPNEPVNRLEKSKVRVSAANTGQEYEVLPGTAASDKAETGSLPPQ